MSRRKFLIGGAASVVAAATLPMTALAAESELAGPGDNQNKKQGKQIMNTITTKDGTLI
jgi:secreted PhoX family phosphatase